MFDSGLFILDMIQKLRCPLLDLLMCAFSLLGSCGALWVAVTLVLLCRRDSRRRGLICAAALMISLLCCNLLLKPLAARPRPFSYREIELLLPAPTDWSFPSGHSSASFAAAAALYDKGRKRSALWFAAAALIAFSRLYLYMHFPGDVLGGCVLGLLCGLAARRYVPRVIDSVISAKKTR